VPRFASSPGIGRGLNHESRLGHQLGDGRQPLDNNTVVITTVQNPMPLIVPFATSLVAESGPITGGLEPGETVTVNFLPPQRRHPGHDEPDRQTSAHRRVKDPSDQQNYGALVPFGAAAARPFEFEAVGTNAASSRRPSSSRKVRPMSGRLWVSSLLPSGLAAPDTREPERHRHTFQWPRGALSIVRPSVRPGRRCQQRHRHALKREPLVPGGP